MFYVLPDSKNNENVAKEAEEKHIREKITKRFDVEFFLESNRNIRRGF